MMQQHHEDVRGGSPSARRRSRRKRGRRAGSGGACARSERVASGDSAMSRATVQSETSRPSLAAWRQLRCPLSVLLQRGFERNQMELDGIGWNNEFNKYKAVRGKGASCLRVYLPLIEFKSLFPLFSSALLTSWWVEPFSFKHRRLGVSAAPELGSSRCDRSSADAEARRHFSG